MTEMNDYTNELYHERLEKIVNHIHAEEAVSLTSIAISMKRIADILEWIKEENHESNTNPN